MPDRKNDKDRQAGRVKSPPCVLFCGRWGLKKPGAVADNGAKSKGGQGVGKHRDWTGIRTEYENGASFGALAKKHDVSITTLKKAAARQEWKHKTAPKLESAARRIKDTTKMTPAEKDTSEMTPTPTSKDEQTSQFDRTVAKLLTKVEQAVDFMPPESTQALKQLTGALKDLQGLLRLTKDELDKEEQRARIDKLRSEIESGAPAGPVVIKFVNTEGAED